MHKNGLKLGIYQNLGRRTCMNYPGITGHMKVDVKTFMEWDVDMIKLDACFTATTTLNKGYINFGRLLNQSPKPIVYSCSWPYYQVHASQVHIVPNWDLISHNCNLFRVFHDIHPDWKSLLATIDFMSDNQEIFRRITGPGSWPDPDMLLIGDSGLSFGEAKAQMAVWCIFPAPLFMSNDPRTIDSKFKSILLNREAIAINQDELTIPGERIFHNQTMDIWRRLLSNNTVAFVVLNRQNDLPIDLKLPIEQVASIVNNTSEIQVFDVFKAVSSSFHIKLNSLNWFDVHVEPKTVTFLRMQPLTII
ncbi:hypothetical protein RDWZM_004227 [Blomia tropicalis]|uniref:Alpha-galactosidase n=1 Tax=Blomia tropicalis TaxID=40697 RepID=A0A9Q0MH85_BLOTA|nr:hypothetical protein RDWZM_004227 [Blomia tropicalis]